LDSMRVTVQVSAGSTSYIINLPRAVCPKGTGFVGKKFYLETRNLNEDVKDPEDKPTGEIQISNSPLNGEDPEDPLPQDDSVGQNLIRIFSKR